MRRRKNPEPESTTPASVLAADSKTVGRFESEDDVILAGSFEGRLRSSRSVQLLTGSRVKGDIQASEIVVQGEVDGNLLARERIRILEGGTVHGDVCAPQVTVQEGVTLNARVRMLGTDHDTKEFLVPVLLRAEAGSAPHEWQALHATTEEFLESIGFAVETRAKPGMLMRSIFRTTEPMSYAQFFLRLGEIESALLEANGDAPSRADDHTPSPAAEPARRLLDRLEGDGAVAVMGSTVVQKRELGDELQLTVRQRPEGLPSPDPENTPKPGDLLLEMQHIHVEVLGEASQLDRVSEL